MLSILKSNLVYSLITKHVAYSNIILTNKIYTYYNAQQSNNCLKYYTKQVNQEKLEKHVFSGPDFKHFVNIDKKNVTVSNPTIDESYLDGDIHGNGQKVFFETYGCQMNVSDTEIAWSILDSKGYKRSEDVNNADIILIMTCSVRDGAETKIWNRLEFLKSIKRRKPIKIGILGCMAERLKHNLLEREKMVDVICGPDAYRDLPRLLYDVTSQQAKSAVNVLLSLEETYADVIPLRINHETKSAFLSIMRGCDNMCTYCIVPFTRGKERSRPLSSIIEECKLLSSQGIKEIVLLGQNVNSYRDLSKCEINKDTKINDTSEGFHTVYKSRKGGKTFQMLLSAVAQVNPEIRIRFTSPHPKDFPDEVLDVMLKFPNICRHIHLPAQSGSDNVLNSMRRGYDIGSYKNLVNRIRRKIPEVTFSGDFIAGFCGETIQDHQLTLDLLKEVRYNFIFCFPYSLREKTLAHRKLSDDVSNQDKSTRHIEIVNLFRSISHEENQKSIGTIQLVLIEGESKRSTDDMAGRNESNIRVVIKDKYLPNGYLLKTGDYIRVEIMSCSSQVLIGKPLGISSIADFH